MSFATLFVEPMKNSLNLLDVGISGFNKFGLVILDVIHLTTNSLP
jgi:hypothetical protein